MLNRQVPAQGNATNRPLPLAGEGVLARADEIPHGGAILLSRQPGSPSSDCNFAQPPTTPQIDPATSTLSTADAAGKRYSFSPTNAFFHLFG